MRHILLVAATLSIVAPPVAAAGDGVPAEVHFVPMDEIVVPIIDSARSTGAMRVKLVLSAADAAAAAQLGADLPKLRETTLAAAIEFARLYASPMAPIDAERLRADLAAALAAAGEPETDVLLVEVSATRV